MNGVFPLVGIAHTASRSMNDMHNEIRLKGDRPMTAFAPVILNQMLSTAFLIVALAVVLNVHNTLKKIRGRYGRLRFSPRLALSHFQRWLAARKTNDWNHPRQSGRFSHGVAAAVIGGHPDHYQPTFQKMAWLTKTYRWPFGENWRMVWTGFWSTSFFDTSFWS